MPRQIIFTSKAAKPPSTHSQAVRAAGLIFVSGSARRPDYRVHHRRHYPRTNAAMFEKYRGDLG